jgi:hypothetical protein
MNKMPYKEWMTANIEELAKGFAQERPDEFDHYAMTIYNEIYR